jgi:hypothetical protein
VERAEVDLESGVARVFTRGDLPWEALQTAVQGKVILSGLRGLLSRVPLVGRRNPGGRIE